MKRCSYLVFMVIGMVEKVRLTMVSISDHLQDKFMIEVI